MKKTLLITGALLVGLGIGYGQAKPVNAIVAAHPVAAHPVTAHPAVLYMLKLRMLLQRTRRPIMLRNTRQRMKLIQKFRLLHTLQIQPSIIKINMLKATTTGTETANWIRKQNHISTGSHLRRYQALTTKAMFMATKKEESR